jgi:hypothetical protein
MADSARLCSPDADLESSELASRGEFGSPMTRRVLLDSKLTKHTVASGSSAEGSMGGEGLVGFKIPSSDEVACSGSMVRARIVVSL